jgi:polyisoprenoid-binding protein YceI
MHEHMTIAEKAVGVTDWTIDSVHSTFEFSFRHSMVSTIKGAFQNVSGEVHFDPEAVAESWVRTEIDMASVDSHNPGRDDHARGASFLDSENHPTSTFVSKRVEPVESNRFRVVGDLTFRGITQEVTFDTVFAGTAERRDETLCSAFVARGTIKRTDFGMELGGLIPAGFPAISNEIDLAMYMTCRPLT